MDIFKPSLSQWEEATVAATSAALALGKTLTTQDSVRIVCPLSNTGMVFVRFGLSGAVSTTGEMPVAPGATEVFYPGAGVTHLATIGTVSDVLYATVGEGE